MQRLVAHNEGTKMGNVMRPIVSENDPEKMLRICAEDPMSADYAEVGKPLLLRAAAELEALRKDAERYRWLRANWGRLLTETQWNGVDVPRTVLSLDIGSAQLGTVSPDSLDAAIDVARGAAPAVGAA